MKVLSGKAFTFREPILCRDILLLVNYNKKLFTKYACFDTGKENEKKSLGKK